VATFGLDETHDPGLKSWVASAHAVDGDFPIQNLPFSVFREQGGDQPFRGGVAIGDAIVDLAALAKTRVLEGVAQEAALAACGPSLNALMNSGPRAWHALRLALSRMLRVGSAAQRDVEACLVAQAQAEYKVPADIGDYTDFYTSIHHATNIGRQFRPDNPLLPNYKWVPIGYHGRASSVIVSGREIRRPWGQRMPAGSTTPALGPSDRLDFELELGVFIGPGNELGDPIPITQAEDHVFGLCLLNDWSARDIQGWEYQPLGPFLSKNFATTISPWIVTFEALAPFRVPFKRPTGDPAPLPYLDSEANQSRGALDIQLQVGLATHRMRRAGSPATTICLTSYRHAYWTIAQLIAHHTVNGCNLRAGDLLGTGTLSGPSSTEAGALIELTSGAKNPIALADGEERCWLQDGDEVVIRGWCQASDAVRIGFGECAGVIGSGADKR
jgi:fumarylacetoacetase